MAADDPVYSDAVEQMQRLIERASQLGLEDPTAVALATTGGNGRPCVRMVLARGLDARGVVFYTNSLSRKGRQIAAHSFAALCFYWEPLHEQLRIEGGVEQVSDPESDSYWANRPRASQIAASASLQSEPLPDARTLENRIQELDREFQGRPIPRPAHWYGYRVVPDRIEFWLGRPARLHERTVYESSPQGWTKSLLYP